MAVIAMPILMGGMARADDDVGGDVGGASSLSEDVVVNENIPKIFIKAVNPGYTVDGKSNVGEMIEIGFLKEHPDDVVSLAGLNFIYTNSSGNESELIKISEYFTATGENIILRLASTDDAELANFNYTKTLAFQGGLTLRMGDTVLDAVCWTGKEGCLKVFKSSQPTTLVRNLTTGEFEHLAEYEPIFHADAIVDNSPSSDSESGEGGMGAAEARCKNLMFSEILSYYAETQDEQFVEFYNSGSEQILLDGCLLEYKNKVYELNGIVKPEEYYVRAATDFSLSKNPTNTNALKIIDANGAVVDKLEYPNG